MNSNRFKHKLVSRNSKPRKILIKSLSTDDVRGQRSEGTRKAKSKNFKWPIFT